MLVACQSSKPASFKEIEGIQDIAYKEIENLMQDNVQFLLYIGRDDCGDCIEFYPILKEYIDDHEKTGIYYLNIRQIRENAKKEDASQAEKDFYEQIYKTFELEWTPTIEWIKNGKIIKKYQYLDEDYIKIEDRAKQKEKRQEFIKEFEDFMNEYFKEAHYEKMS